MKGLCQIYSTAVGKKFVVAATGVVLFGFVVAHMVGNLKAFAGVDPQTGVHALDLYAQFLRVMGQELVGKETVLWVTRIVLLGAFIGHLVTVFLLKKQNNRAGGGSYACPSHHVSTYASRSMVVTGGVLLIFIIFHILHLTLGVIPVEFEHGQVYKNVHGSFQMVFFTVGYVVAMVALGFHLFHGIWSLTQTLGVNRPEWDMAIRGTAVMASVVVAAGFALVPLAVLFGVLPAPL